HMPDPDEVADMFDRLRDARGRGIADGGIPIADADQPTGRGDPANLLVAEVAVDLARRLHAAVAGDDGAAGDLEDVGDAGGRAMRDVDDHALRLHRLDHLPPE